MNRFVIDLVHVKVQTARLNIAAESEEAARKKAVSLAPNDGLTWVPIVNDLKTKVAGVKTRLHVKVDVLPVEPTTTEAA